MVINSSRRIVPLYLPSFFVLLFLFSPYLILFSRYGYQSSFDYSEIRWAINNSIIQGFLSAAIATLISVFMAFGLVRQNKLRPVLNYLILLPSFLPPLFILLAFLEVVEPFPIGNWGVSFVLGFTMAGLLATQLAEWMAVQIGGMIETAITLGASRRQLIIETIKMMGEKIVHNFLLSFCLAFTSFSVPLVVGGGRGTNLEILIYEKIRILNDWKAALSLAFLQSVLLFAFSTIRAQIGVSKKPVISLQRISSKFAWICCWAYGVFFIFPFLGNFISGYQQATQIEGLLSVAARLIPSTVFLAIAGGVAAVIAMAILSLVSELQLMQKILSGFVAPSTAIVGFSTILISPFFDNPFAIYILGFLIIVINSIYRLGLLSGFLAISGQLEVARVIGADSIMAWREITLPQIFPTIMRLGGIIAFWIAGDFALSKIVFTSDVTLAMLVQGLMESYRIDAAIFFAVGVLLIGAAIYTLFWSLSYVFDRRS